MKESNQTLMFSVVFFLLGIACMYFFSQSVHSFLSEKIITNFRGITLVVCMILFGLGTPITFFGCNALYTSSQNEKREKVESEYRDREYTRMYEKRASLLEKMRLAYGSDPEPFPKEKREKITAAYLKRVVDRDIDEAEDFVDLVRGISFAGDISLEEATYFVQSLFRELKEEELKEA